MDLSFALQTDFDSWPSVPELKVEGFHIAGDVIVRPRAAMLGFVVS